MKEFKGRIIASRDWQGEAIVSNQKVNMMATYYMSAYKNAKNVSCSDEANTDLYGKNLTGKALCLPCATASNVTGLIIETICQLQIGPAAYLFSEHIDEVSASGIVLAKVWEDSDVICIDNLGEEFLEAVKTGDEIEIKANGTVIIKDKNE